MVPGVLEAAELLRTRQLSSRELVAECLARIDADDVTGAWIRVYVDAARAAAAAADERLAAGDAPLLCGIPIGLKDLYAAAGFPLTASSTLLHEAPETDCTAWARLRARKMVLLGHLHTHEFAAAPGQAATRCCALARVARRVRRRRDRRTDGPDRAAPPRPRLRRALLGRGGGRAHVLLELDGLPVVAFPTGLGARSGLPTGASLIGRPGADWDLLAYAR